MTTDLVLASHNAHKLHEFQQIVADALVDTRFLAYEGPEAVESGVTFDENALIKARAASSVTGLPALADDSGLCVDVMGGSPGIFSARWGGPERSDARNRELLLWQLQDIPDDERSARFVCSIALVIPGDDVRIPPRQHVVHGVWEGRILREERGEHGFGYDPIFAPDGEAVSSAELSEAAKNAVSHRSKAFAAIIPVLQGELGLSGRQ